MSYWLTKKKKADLVELSGAVGLRTDGLRKAELEDALRAHLEEHYEELKDHQLFQAYYETVGRSPIKLINPPDVILPDGERRARKRTSRYTPGATAMRSEDTFRSSVSPIKETSVTPSLDEPPASSAAVQNQVALTHTPRTNSVFLGQIPLPPSPADVATAIELQTNILKQRTREAITSIAIKERLESAREKLSNVLSVYCIISFYEISMLLRYLIPLTYEIAIPPIPPLNAHFRFRLPDLFVALSSTFWYPLFTHVFISHVLPLTAAYFFNLTTLQSSSLPKSKSTPAPPTASPSSALIRHSPRDCIPLEPTPAHKPKAFDFLSYSIARALMSYLVHYKGCYFMGLVSEGQTKILESALGKEVGLVSAGIIGVVSVWEGILVAGGGGDGNGRK